MIRSKIYFHNYVYLGASGFWADTGVLPALRTCITSAWVYPISLSYHEQTFTRLPSTTFVKFKSAIDANGHPTMSEDTSASFVTAKISFHLSSLAAFSRISFTSSFVVGLLEINTISDIEPAITGTRNEMPSNLFASCGRAFVTAIAAPLEKRNGVFLW